MQFKTYYYACYENGIPGFVFIGAVAGGKKPSLQAPRLIEGLRTNKEFIETMKGREKEKAEFLEKYYALKTEQKYTNLDKVCRIREIEADEAKMEPP